MREYNTKKKTSYYKEVRKQLVDAEFRAAAYKRMIEVAESMGMPVRKKAGAKW